MAVGPKRDPDLTGHGAASEPEETAWLFEPPKAVPLSTEPKVRVLQHPIWTENKAQLIERYLFLFVQVTKHGTYIDGFAGPQKASRPEMWAAKLVLESQPRWLRQIHLFEKDRKKLRALHELVGTQPPRKRREPKRDISIHSGDFNVLVLRMLEQGGFKRSQAAFCLLDQQTFECHWNALRALASYKADRHKIELFYFLTNHWFVRAAKNVRRRAILDRWWGRPDWEVLLPMRRDDRRDVVVARFRDELGYRSVKPWPIWSRRTGGVVMYFMIHATDHPDAPGLMRRAYSQAVRPREGPEQLRMGLLVSDDSGTGHLSSGRDLDGESTCP